VSLYVCEPSTRIDVYDCKPCLCCCSGMPTLFRFVTANCVRPDYQTTPLPLPYQYRPRVTGFHPSKIEYILIDRRQCKL
jgi:hypothetical protein